jgi:hypothetical protein
LLLGADWARRVLQLCHLAAYIGNKHGALVLKERRLLFIR